MKAASHFLQPLKINLIIVIFLCFVQPLLKGQNGINYNSEDAYNGFTLCTAENLGSTFLLDNCGEIVNRWSNTFPRHYCRLTNEGNLLYISGGKIIEKDWNNNLLQSITINTNDLILDYEVMKMENGNYLAVARKIVGSSYFDQIGWSPGTPKPDRVDGVIEIAPNGNVVWEWNIGDHTIQDKIPSAPNFGNIKDHPELVDVNAISDFDWQFGESFMINGMDYNPDLDQIVVSVRKVSEVMIIDHSTTTAEAKGSTGGKYGKGGDFLYRWGNPQNYKQGTEANRTLYYQHNPNWVKYGPHKGKIIMYNNGLNRNPGAPSYSSVHIIDTPVESDGSYTLPVNAPFQPSNADVTIDRPTTGTDFYSGYTSGAQVLPNGNIYITVGFPSDFLEVKVDGTPVWKYTLDFSTYIFRSEKYPNDFPGFAGRDMTGSGTVETPSSSYNCQLFTSTQEQTDQNLLNLHYDPSTYELRIKNISSTNNRLEIRNLQGQLMHMIHDIDNNTQIVLDNIPMGIYIITFNDLVSFQKISYKIGKY
jgi:hypothetical protein